MPTSPQSNHCCLCSVVTQYSFPIHVHTDIDECSMGTSGCQQLCFNTNGSYYCQCNTGYELNTGYRLDLIINDNSSCIGTYRLYCILCVL